MTVDINEELKSVSNLGKATRRVGKEHGFTQHHFGVNPNLDGDGPNHVTLVFELDPDADTKPEPIVLQVQSAMEDSMEATKRAEREERVKQAREELGDLDLGDFKPGRGGGFL